MDNTTLADELEAKLNVCIAEGLTFKAGWNLISDVIAALRTPAPAPAVVGGDVVSQALDDLQQAEAEYRKAHDLHGDGSQQAGRAWDLMRRVGDRARTALQAQPAQAQGDDVVERVRRSLDLSEKTIRNHHKAGNVTEPGIVAIADVLADARAALAAMQQAPKMEIMLPPASIEGDYLQGWCEGQAWMIENYGTSEEWDHAISLTEKLGELLNAKQQAPVVDDAKIAAIRAGGKSS
jgi:hypothetical protein